MRPGMIANFEAHAMNVSNFLPAHEVGGVGHPAMGYEERGAESQLLQQWGNKGSMRFDCVVESQDHNFVACSFLCTGWSVSILGGDRVAREQTQQKIKREEVDVSDVLQRNCNH